MHHIPLSSAYLCQDCDAVGNNAMQCPACASEVLMALSCIFGRKEEEPVPELFLYPAIAA